MNPFVRLSVPEDAELLGDALRDADLLELVRGGDFRAPADILMDGVTKGACCWSLFDGVSPIPAAMFGAAGDPQDPSEKTGLVWFLAGEHVYGIWRYVVRHTRPYIEQMHVRFPVLHNWVDAENHITRRWLAWAGFTEISVAFLPSPFMHVARASDV